MDTCEFKSKCGFFRKFGERKSKVWRSLVDFYCNGDPAAPCERKKRYLYGHGHISDDLLPTGGIVPDPFQKLS